MVIIMIFCNSASLIFTPAKYGASIRVKLAKYMLLSIETYVFACMENYIKINFVGFSVIFLLSSRHKHICPSRF